MIMRDVKTMTNKAYIVANEQQEREVLEKLEQEGLTWNYSMKKITQVIPSHFHNIVTFPYSLRVFDSYVFWDLVDGLENDEIVFDGRKEEQMSDKYVVSQEFMNELEDWKKRGNTEVYFVGSYDLSMLPDYVKRWWNYPEINNFECNNRLIAIIRWVNGEDVFEVEKPKKWVVRSKETDEDGDYHYVDLDNFKNLKSVSTIYGLDFATKFDAKEEAESWANSHQEVVEVVDV